MSEVVGRMPLIEKTDVRASSSARGTTRCCANHHPGPFHMQAHSTIQITTLMPMPAQGQCSSISWRRCARRACVSHTTVDAGGTAYMNICPRSPSLTHRYRVRRGVVAVFAPLQLTRNSIIRARASVPLGLLAYCDAGLVPLHLRCASILRTSAVRTAGARAPTQASYGTWIRSAAAVPLLRW